VTRRVQRLGGRARARGRGVVARARAGGVPAGSGPRRPRPPTLGRARRAAAGRSRSTARPGPAARRSPSWSSTSASAMVPSRQHRLIPKRPESGDPLTSHRPLNGHAPNPGTVARHPHSLWTTDVRLSRASHRFLRSGVAVPARFAPVPGADMTNPTDRGRSGRRRSELERLIDRTVLGPTHPELGTCWSFTGTATPYGRIAKAQDTYTHRLGWKLLRGPIPEDKELHHRCGVYACWNPDHLQIASHAENLAFSRKSHCKHGHPLSGQNLRVNPRTGARSCRECLRENQRRLRATAQSSQPGDHSDGKPGRPRGSLRSDLERLVDRTVLGRSHPELGTCWLFTGPTDPYGRIGKGPERFVHRLGWKLLRGPIPDGTELHHRCGVHACWNPDHLEIVRHAENLAYERKSHCGRGHPLSGTNLRIDPRTGARICRACAAEYQRAFRDRKRSKPPGTPPE
jgi:HNH endonuclease